VGTPLSAATAASRRVLHGTSLTPTENAEPTGANAVAPGIDPLRRRDLLIGAFSWLSPSWAGPVANTSHAGGFRRNSALRVISGSGSINTFISIPIPRSVSDILSTIILPSKAINRVHSIDYHITVLFIGSAAPQDILSRLKLIDIERPREPIRLKEFGVFEESEEHIFFASVAPNNWLTCLHRKLKDGLRIYVAEHSYYKYVPHVTLAYSRVHVRLAVSDASKKALSNITFIPTTLHVLRANDAHREGPYQLIGVISF
jgi:2'-5' RNA ligase